ncbi:MAG: flavodoxin family protein [Clostridia bacterium]|nr:flavodoxin family protein [Clostridia bacterium]
MNTPCSRKTLVLFGAPHTDGATGTLLNLFLSTCEDDVMVVDCYARAVAPCDDCRACHQLDRCAKRDMDDIYDALENADRLAVVTPVYNRSFPAPLKAVIDRFQCYWAARFIRGKRPPIEREKTALLLTVEGSSRRDGEQLKTQLEPQLTVLHVTAFDTLHVMGTDGKVDWESVAKQLDELV